MNNTYYVYGTFIERNRYKFKNKKDAEKFIKYANKECKSSIEWIFFEESIKEEFETDKDAILPIPVFYDPESGKILEGTVPQDLREELKGELIETESE